MTGEAFSNGLLIFGFGMVFYAYIKGGAELAREVVVPEIQHNPNAWYSKFPRTLCVVVNLLWLPLLLIGGLVFGLCMVGAKVRYFFDSPKKYDFWRKVYGL